MQGNDESDGRQRGRSPTYQEVINTLCYYYNPRGRSVGLFCSSTVLIYRIAFAFVYALASAFVLGVSLSLAF